MRMRAAALPRNRIHAFDIFRAIVVEEFVYHSHGFVFFEAGAHRVIQLMIGAVDQHGRMIQKEDFVLRLDFSRVRHQLLAVDHRDAFLLQSEQNRRLNDIDAHWLLMQAAHLELDLDFARHVFRAAHLGRHRSA